ncbi:MAG: DNA cytosine methyltransferase [Candidatus Methanospirareceae archaeon]
MVYDNGLLRQLSWLESVRAQSFPDEYYFAGTVAQKYHRLGDAVPPKLAEAIARSIRELER